MLHIAEKVVIIAERLIAGDICELIENIGATGYTVIPAAGKGSGSNRARSDRFTLVDDFANVKIEIIVPHREMAETIIESVTEQFFTDYSGISYIEDVKILRVQKFVKSSTGLSERKTT